MSAVEQALRLVEANDFSGADQLLANHLRQLNDDTEAWYIRAHINLAAELADTALNFITQAIALRPQEPSFYVLGGDAAMQLGDADKATTFYIHALRHADGDIVVLLRLFQILLLRAIKQPDLQPAITQIIGQLHQQELGSDICVQIAHAFANAGAVAEATTWFERAAQKAENVADKNRCRLEIACLVNDEPSIIERIGFYKQDDARLANDLWAATQVPLPVMAKPGLTCVVTTNLTKKLVINRAKAPPKIDLIADTLVSWRTALQPSKDTRVIIYFDQPKTPEADDEIYANALADYAAQHGYEVALRRGNGLKNNVADALATTETEFFTLLEHDFLFNNCPTQDAVIQLLNQHSFINLVQFNRRPNVAVRRDVVLWPETRVATHPLLRTPRFSNNPYIGRTAKIVRDFLPIFSNQNRFDGINGGAGGLEEQVEAVTSQLVQKFGFGFVQRWTGYYLYGAPLDAPRLTHTGI